MKINEMNSKYAVFLFFLFLFGCTGTSSLPNEPESVMIQWIEWWDKDMHKELKDISTGNTLIHVLDMEKFYDGVEKEEVEVTVIEKLNCEEEGEDVKCIYCCNEGESESFFLTKEKGQWKVRDIIVDIGDIDEETLKQEKQLEEMLNKKLPNE